MIWWPDNYERYLLEKDRDEWKAYAIVDGYWYKGVANNKQDAIRKLGQNVAAKQHVGKPEPSRYVKGEYRRASAERPIDTKAIAGLDIGDLDL